jgi:hypothetical protein
MKGMDAHASKEFRLKNAILECPQEAIDRRITYVATYVNGKTILPMSPKKFLKTLRRMATEPNETA